MWVALHAIADAFPIRPSVEEQRDARDLFMNVLPHLLPCIYCNRHLQELVKQHPVDVDSGPGLSKWLILIHNLVNQRLGHPILSDEEAYADQQFYRSIRWRQVVEDLKQKLQGKGLDVPTTPTVRRAANDTRQGSPMTARTSVAGATSASSTLLYITVILILVVSILIAWWFYRHPPAGKVSGAYSVSARRRGSPFGRHA